jgi:hypothetical protein
VVSPFEKSHDVIRSSKDSWAPSCPLLLLLLDEDDDDSPSVPLYRAAMPFPRTVELFTNVYAAVYRRQGRGEYAHSTAVVGQVVCVMCFTQVPENFSKLYQERRYIYDCGGVHGVKVGRRKATKTTPTGIKVRRRKVGMSTATNTTPADTVATCAICCDQHRRSKLHMICGTCKGTDKLCCLQCWAKLLTTCDPQSDCLALHMICPWCAQPVPYDKIRASALWDSTAYHRVASGLYYNQMAAIISERHDMRAMLNDAVSALTHSPLHSFDHQRQRAIIAGARRGYRIADSFLAAYDGWRTFRRSLPHFEDEEEVRRAVEESVAAAAATSL